MNGEVEVVEFNYYHVPIPDPVLLSLGAICILLAAAGAVLLFKLFRGKR